MGTVFFDMAYRVYNTANINNMAIISDFSPISIDLKRFRKYNVNIRDEENIYMEKSNMFSVQNEYTNMTDEELVSCAQNGDKKAEGTIISRYSEIVNMKARRFFIVGAEKDDIVQEGLIGIYKAIKSYSIDRDNSFKTFVNMCIERQLITAIKSSNRQKHIPLNSSFSLNGAAFDNDETSTLLDIIDFNLISDPLEEIEKKEYLDSIQSKISGELSDFEKQVLDCFIQGKSYAEISEQLDTPVKSIDNAIQRIRKKANKYK